MWIQKVEFDENLEILKMSCTFIFFNIIIGPHSLLLESNLMWNYKAHTL